jgi:hypothetical protein
VPLESGEFRAVGGVSDADDAVAAGRGDAAAVGVEHGGKDLVGGVLIASGPKTTLRHNPINGQNFGRSLIASFWLLKGDPRLEFEMTFRSWRWKMSMGYGKARSAVG